MDGSHGTCRRLKRAQTCIPVTVSTSYYTLSRAYCDTACFPGHIAILHAFQGILRYYMISRAYCDTACFPGHIVLLHAFQGILRYCMLSRAYCVTTRFPGHIALLHAFQGILRYYMLSRAYCVTAHEVRSPTQAFKSGLRSGATYTQL